MGKGVIVYADTVAEAQAALARVPAGERVALFARRDYDPPDRLDFYRVRSSRDPRADTAAVRVACPWVQWRLLEATTVSVGRESHACQPGEDPAMSPRAVVEGATLAVITCHWNFAGYRTPTRNLLRFLREMDEAGIAVYGLEMHLPGTAPVMAANPRWQIVELNENQILWQKEAALNRLALAVPAHIPCIATIDADVRFADPSWVAKTVAALEETPVVQPFTEAVWVDEMGRVELRRTCCTRDGLDDRWRTHPGFAWAARREFFDLGIGMYPWCMSGAGDTVTATALLRSAPTAAALAACGPRNLVPDGVAARWFEAVRDYMDGRQPGWVEGRLWHEWHGARENRRYAERHRFMRHVEVGRHLAMGEDNLLTWTPAATRAMRNAMADYFAQRKEDG